MQILKMMKGTFFYHTYSYVEELKLLIRITNPHYVHTSSRHDHVIFSEAIISLVDTTYAHISHLPTSYKPKTIVNMCSATAPANADPKIIDLLNKDPEGLAHVSLEYFPPRTEQGVKNLHARMERMLANTKCLYTDMTWGAGGSTAELSLELAIHAQKTGHVSNLHLTCTNMEKDGDPIKGVHDALQEAYDGGIRNIVALRGDPQEGQDEWTATKGGFTCALDLVKYIRKEFGDDFGISVAGYPEGHPNRISELTEEEAKDMTESELSRCCTHEGITYVCKDDDYKKEMDYLKEKVDAGAGKF